MQDHLARVVELYESGALNDAVQECERAVSICPDDAALLGVLGTLKYRLNDPVAAAEHLGKAAALQPKDIEVHVSLAEVLRALGKYEEAAEHCRMALELAPDCAEALINLGMVFLDQGQIESAIEQFNVAIKLCPESSEAHNNLGMALLRNEQFDDALTHFQEAVKLNPSAASAQTNLGHLLASSHRPDEAIPYCRAAVRLLPTNAVMHCNLAIALQCGNRESEARAEYREAAKLDPDLPKLHLQWSVNLEREGKFYEAETFLKQAVELDYDNPQSWAFLARYYQRDYEFEDAARIWRRVVDLIPGHPGPRGSLAMCLVHLGHYAEATEILGDVLQKHPNWVPAHYAFAAMQTELGFLEKAESTLRAVVPLDPLGAYIGLGHLLGKRLSDSDFATMEEIFEKHDIENQDRPRLLYAMAYVLDARGDYAKAAKYLRRANAAKAACRHQDHRSFDAEQLKYFVDTSIATFTKEFFCAVAAGGIDTCLPVFVFGLPRSGTTLVEQILSSHSSVYGAGELTLAYDTFVRIPRLTKRAGNPVNCMKFLDAENVRVLAGDYIRGLGEISNGGATRIVDKMPENFSMLGLLAAMFPRATFIHCRRDLRDVAVSHWMTDFRAIKYSCDPNSLALRFKEYCRLMHHWAKVLPITIHEVQYESTVVDLENTARNLLRACGLEWEPTCLEFYRNPRPVKTASVTQVRQPIYNGSLGRWKHYEHELADIFSMLELNEDGAQRTDLDNRPA